jgi:hypothetical protein
MNAEFNQFRHREREAAAARVEADVRARSTEFETVEEALRVDRELTPMPPQLGERVAEAIRREPARPSSWWSRWFRRG